MGGFCCLFFFFFNERDHKTVGKRKETIWAKTFGWESIRSRKGANVNITSWSVFNMDGYFKFVLCRGGINQRKIGKRFQKSGNGWTDVSICLALLCFTLRGFETVYYSAFSSFKGFFSFLLPLVFSSVSLGSVPIFLLTSPSMPTYPSLPLVFLIRFLYIDFSAGVSLLLPFLSISPPVCVSGCA